MAPKTVKCIKSEEKRLPEERLGGASEKTSEKWGHPGRAHMRLNHAGAVETQFSGLPERELKASTMSSKMVTFGTIGHPFWDILTEKSEKRSSRKGCEKRMEKSHARFRKSHAGRNKRSKYLAGVPSKNQQSMTIDQ
jgi:hypothetical protein